MATGRRNASETFGRRLFATPSTPSPAGAPIARQGGVTLRSICLAAGDRPSAPPVPPRRSAQRRRSRRPAMIRNRPGARWIVSARTDIARRSNKLWSNENERPPIAGFEWSRCRHEELLQTQVWWTTFGLVLSQAYLDAWWIDIHFTINQHTYSSETIIPNPHLNLTTTHRHRRGRLDFTFIRSGPNNL